MQIEIVSKEGLEFRRGRSTTKYEALESAIKSLQIDGDVLRVPLSDIPYKGFMASLVRKFRKSGAQYATKMADGFCYVARMA